MGVSQATFYRWKKVYGGLMPSEVLTVIDTWSRVLRGHEGLPVGDGNGGDLGLLIGAQ